MHLLHKYLLKMSNLKGFWAIFSPSPCGLKTASSQVQGRHIEFSTKFLPQQLLVSDLFRELVNQFAAI